MAEIVLENITKTFGDVVAVNNLSMKIENKEFIVFLGPSGCGKTTTLRCISGLETPDEGRVFLDGEDVTLLRASKRDIAFVFQLYALYPLLSAYENIAFPLKTQRYDKETIDKEVNRVIKILRLDRGILNKKPKHLSGGDMQRVALARAIVRRPKAFLLDEPIGTLDAKFREEMRMELKKLHVDVGATTVYVTHDQAEAMSMGDRIAVMRDGVIQQLGTPHQIYSSPRNLFVANFVGSPGMNFIECSPEKDSGGRIRLRLSTDSMYLPVSDEMRQKILEHREEKRELVLGIRPEDISFSLEEGKDHNLPVEVYVREDLGSYNIIDVKLGGETIKVRAPHTMKPDIGKPGFVAFDMDRASLFDKETGNSIL
ncbi:MAG: ABC transporter ATP-binding protein [Spirochaetota bacterium]